jgi:hypothetical protein
MRRAIALVALMAVAAGACSDRLGRDFPDCAESAPNSIIVQIQSVETAGYVPCIDDLEVGWVYHDVVPRSGLAEFTLGSDRMGDPFLRVRTTAACDPSGTEVVSDERPARLFRAVTADLTVDVVVIPVGPTPLTSQVALDIIGTLHGTTLNDREIKVTLDSQEGETAPRIQRARDAGAHVILVDTRDAEEGTVTLLRAGDTAETRGSLRDATKRIEATVSPPTYTGSWFYLFEGGCTEYRFTARGPGAETVAADVRRDLGFTDVTPIKEQAREMGYRIP